MRRGAASVRLATLFLGVTLAAASGAEPAKSEKPKSTAPAKEAGAPVKMPAFDADAPEQLARLQADQLRMQQQILEMQAAIDRSIESGDMPPGDPRLKKIGLMRQKLEILDAQAAKLRKRLPPPEKIPPETQGKLDDQARQIKEGSVKIEDGNRKLKQSLKDGQGNKLDPPPPPGRNRAEGRPPASAAEAGESISRGDVDSPRSLIETFIQIPDKDVPKSNLDYYRKQGR